MEFSSPVILIVSSSILCVNFMFLLLSIDLIFLPKVSTLRCRFLPNDRPKILSSASDVLYNLFISIIKMDCNVFMALQRVQQKHTFIQQNTHQDRNPQVSHV